MWPETVPLLFQLAGAQYRQGCCSTFSRFLGGGKESRYGTHVERELYTDVQQGRSRTPLDPSIASEPWFLIFNIEVSMTSEDTIKESGRGRRPGCSLALLRQNSNQALRLAPVLAEVVAPHLLLIPDDPEFLKDLQQLIRLVSERIPARLSMACFH